MEWREERRWSGGRRGDGVEGGEKMEWREERRWSGGRKENGSQGERRKKGKMDRESSLCSYSLQTGVPIAVPVHTMPHGILLPYMENNPSKCITNNVQSRLGKLFHLLNISTDKMQVQIPY